MVIKHQILFSAMVAAVLALLTLGACASEGYSSWVCVSVCLSGENKLLRSLTPVVCSGYSIYMTNSRFKTCGFR